jgi:hypothetical protein
MCMNCKPWSIRKNEQWSGIWDHLRIRKMIFCQFHDGCELNKMSKHTQFSTLISWKQKTITYTVSALGHSHYPYQEHFLQIICEANTRKHITYILQSRTKVFCILYIKIQYKRDIPALFMTSIVGYWMYILSTSWWYDDSMRQKLKTISRGCSALDNTSILQDLW